MVMVLWQCGSWLSWLCLNVSIHLEVDAVRNGGLLRLRGLWGVVSFFGSRKLLLYLNVRVDSIHAEIEIRTVLLVILGTNMRLRLLCG